jgi:sterol 24-C-methyltransferase
MNESILSTMAGMLEGRFQHGLGGAQVRGTVEGYESHFDERPAPERKGHAAGITRDFYQLVTDFYEVGWGQSFHFAPRFHDESLRESITRYEHLFALRLGLRPGMKVLDVGCGVGGPLRSIARVSGASITGITISPYQVARARKHTRRARLSHLCAYVEGDYNRMPLPSGSFDAAYTIEACCHAADRRGPFGETFRVLKPGALFAGSDWCLSAGFYAEDPEHARIKEGIEKGNAISQLVHAAQIDQALVDSGFEILEARDLLDAGDTETPWYAPLTAGLTPAGLRNGRAGGWLTHRLVQVLEALKLSPQGTVQTHDVLRLAQASLVEGGRARLFTPLYFWVARKPG